MLNFELVMCIFSTKINSVKLYNFIGEVIFKSRTNVNLF